MTSRQTRKIPAASRKSADSSERMTLPASEVGVTLTISEKALKEIERLQEETVKAAQEDQQFSWR